MKKLTTFFAAMLLSLAAFAQEPVEGIGVQGPLVFDNTQFHLAWTSHPNEHYWMQEYLPTGETVESFNQMLGIHLIETDFGVEEVIRRKMGELNERKSTDPVCNYQVTESPDGKEYMLDAIMGASEHDKMTAVEFTILRFKQVEIAKGKKAMLIYAYCRRSYGDNIMPFLQTLGENRIGYLNAMIASEIPTISVKAQ